LREESGLADILIAEDDENIRLLLGHHLKQKHSVFFAQDGREALETISSRHIDLLIADIMMPRMDGFDLVRNIRNLGLLLPVIMLTANQSFDAKRIGFRTGTDDYLTKPVNLEELMWRVQALLRRAHVSESDKLQVRGITADPSTFTVSRGEVSIALPNKEFELLFKFLSTPGRIYTKTQLMNDIWGFDSDSGEDTIKTHVYRLRSKVKVIGEIEITAVKGVGYKADIVGASADE
jgi:DNA-binding response OmpR family regulator